MKVSYIINSKKKEDYPISPLFILSALRCFSDQDDNIRFHAYAFQRMMNAPIFDEPLHVCRIMNDDLMYGATVLKHPYL